MAKTVRRITSRSGKRSKMQEAHDSFVFARYFFMVAIIASIVLLTGVIITLGHLDMTVSTHIARSCSKFMQTSST